MSLGGNTDIVSLAQTKTHRIDLPNGRTENIKKSTRRKQKTEVKRNYGKMKQILEEINREKKIQLKITDVLKTNMKTRKQKAKQSLDKTRKETEK